MNNNNFNDNGFYNGYNDNPDGYKDPFASDNNIPQQKEVKRPHADYDHLSNSVVTMETLRNYYPDAKLASPTDARERLLKMAVHAIILTVIGLIFALFGISSDSQQTRFMADAAKAEGSLSMILPVVQFPEVMLDEDCYSVIYKYEYNGTTYRDSRIMTEKQMQNITLITPEQTGENSDEKPKSKLQVYVNKDNPSESMLTKSNDLRNGWFYWAVFGVAAVVPVIVGIKRYYDCMSCKTAVYINRKNKKKYQNLKT